MTSLNIMHRDPKQVMTLSKLGSFHQSKLSFLRSFIREFHNWNFEKKLFELDENGYGTVVYSVSKNERTYSLVCFANELNDSERSDRVIATKWDAAFVLHDGNPSKDDIERLRQNVPKQEVGRCSYKELTLSRANRSVRLFNHVVDKLANGEQPDTNLLNEVGYLYRTTAVYGSGKFGLADRYRIKDREEINGPFRLEMMLVYLVRQFTFDQVNHIANKRNPSGAVELDKNIARNLGIGNSTGLGMAPFIINHPSLLHQWIFAREEALKQIREIEIIEDQDFELFKKYLNQSEINLNHWKTESDYQNTKINELKTDIQKLKANYLSEVSSKNKNLWNDLYEWAERHLNDEGIELIVSLMMEPYDNIVTPLVSNMSSDEEDYFEIPSYRNTDELIEIIENYYKNIIKIDFSVDQENENFWFISKNKEEPRIANRFEEEGSNLEQPLAIARDIKELYSRLKIVSSTMKIADFLASNNDLRHVIRRCFIVEKLPYSEIQDNTIGSNLIPIDMLRLKLSYFGAQKFDPRSDKWLRICMYQGAPLMNEISNSQDNWVYN